MLKCKELNEFPRDKYTYINVGGLTVNGIRIELNLCIDGGDFVVANTCNGLLDVVFTSDTKVFISGDLVGSIVQRNNTLVFVSADGTKPLDTKISVDKIEGYFRAEEIILEHFLSKTELLKPAAKGEES